MLRVKLLRNLMLLSLAIAVLFPCYEYLSIHPAYNELLTVATESEAVRYASYMVRTLGLENQALTRDNLPEGIDKRLLPVSRDNHMIKLRIFSARGEVIFSTEAAEIGSVNDKDYFREIVAKGLVYSKVVKKDRRTAEGALSSMDVVETYVPFMAGAEFGGAMEVYYDITASVGRIRMLSLQTMVTTVLMSLGFLVAIGVALKRTQLTLRERDRAEEALRVANEDLEQRVVERTRELSDANEQLTVQVAERTEAQQALSRLLEDIRADREKLDAILGSVPDGVVVTDGSLNVLHMNAAAERLLDVPLASILGHSFDMLRHRADYLATISRELRSTASSAEFDFEIAGRDGRPVSTFQGRVSRFVSLQSSAPGRILLIRDVTREREVERMKSAFLGMAAHELNTPLTTIIGYSELLTAEETAGRFKPEQQKEYLQLIHNTALALGGLVDDLLDVSRIESGRQLVLNYQSFSIAQLVGEVAAGYRAKYPRHRFEMELPPAGEAMVNADLQRIEQVVDHVISNAAKYSPGGGTVRVSLAMHGESCELCVEDKGIGMDEEQLAHIFDRFYRADSSDTAVQGVGLGMSIVRHVVLAHHGEIGVESQPGRGTRVRIVLPVTPPAGPGQGSAGHS